MDDHINAFKAAQTEDTVAPPVKSDRDKLLYKYARKSDIATEDVLAATQGLKSKEIRIESFEKMCALATEAIANAQLALGLLGQSLPSPPRWRTKNQAHAFDSSCRLQSLLLRSCTARLEAAVKDHIGRRVEVSTTLRDGLRRQVAIAFPQVDNVKEMNDVQLSQLMQRQSGVSKKELANMSRRVDVLANLESNVMELVELLVTFTQILQAQHEQIRGSADSVESALDDCREAEVHLKYAVESDRIYRKAITAMIIIMIIILCVLFFPFKSVPDWLAFGGDGAAADPPVVVLDTQLDIAEAFETPATTEEAEKVLQEKIGVSGKRKEKKMKEKEAKRSAEEIAEKKVLTAERLKGQTAEEKAKKKVLSAEKKPKKKLLTAAEKAAKYGSAARSSPANKTVSTDEETADDKALTDEASGISLAELQGGDSSIQARFRTVRAVDWVDRVATGVIRDPRRAW